MVAQGKSPPQLTAQQESGAVEETGSYRTPSVENARVRDAMNNAIVTCSRDAGLSEMWPATTR